MPRGFFFNDTATTEIYTLSLHDALPISFGLNLFDGDRLLFVVHECQNPFDWFILERGEKHRAEGTNLHRRTNSSSESENGFPKNRVIEEDERLGLDYSCHSLCFQLKAYSPFGTRLNRFRPQCHVWKRELGAFDL